MDIAYLSIASTFYYICSVLYGYSRTVVHWEIRESMTEPDVGIIRQRARARVPGERSRIMWDNGPQFIARDFKTFIRKRGMEHVRTSPYHTQSNGKKERYWRSLKGEAIRPKIPLPVDEASDVVKTFVECYDTIRLHSAIGYVTPADMRAGRADQIHANETTSSERPVHAAAGRRIGMDRLTVLAGQGEAWREDNRTVRISRWRGTPSSR